MASTLPRYLAIKPPPSEIEHEPRRFRPRDANLHDLAGRLLGIGQDLVAMIGRALDHADLADAAIAALAIMHPILAGFDQHGENGLARRNLEGLSGIVQHDLERLIARHRRSGGKNLEAQASIGPAEVSCALDRRID